jgi:hypothetical protein
MDGWTENRHDEDKKLLSRLCEIAEKKKILIIYLWEKPKERTKYENTRAG